MFNLVSQNRYLEYFKENIKDDKRGDWSLKYLTMKWKHSSTMSTYEASNSYDGNQSKTHNTLIQLKVNMEPSKQQGSQKKLLNYKWYQWNTSWWP